MDDAASPWPLLLSLQRRMQGAQDVAELGFVIANETWHLVHYRQACVFLFDRIGRPRLLTVSALASIHEETPYTLWLGGVCAALAADTGTEPAKPRRLTASMLDEELRDGWSEWWPDNAVYAPLTTADGQRVGATLYVREEGFSDGELEWLALLQETAAYCLAARQGRRHGWVDAWRRLREQPRRRRLLAAAAVVALFLPVRMSVLAPAEIIALRAEAVAAPMEGVIKVFHAQPNQNVKKDELLFSLDDTTLRNRREVAAKSLAVARADALLAQQKSFDSVQSKGELATALGKVREKEAELAYLDEALTRVDVRASHDGVFVYGDANDWLGKPIATGERIAQLAQADELGVMVWVPVGDAINLEPGASIRIYLQTAPLSALSAHLVQTSYQALLSPDNVASYRIRGRLDEGEAARIGLRGVAKVYGAWRPFVYWALRRPLGALRQWVGL